MATSLITKKKIAKAFKKQMEGKPFDKISVVDIMDQAQIRRQTFYNHFLDKYDLLDWIFETDLQEQVTNNLNYINGFQLLEELLFYFERHRPFYAQVFDIKGQNDFYSYFDEYCQVLIDKIISEYQGPALTQMGPDYRHFLSLYHAKALTHLIKCYVTQSDFSLSVDHIKHLIMTSIH